MSGAAVHRACEAMSSKGEASLEDKWMDTYHAIGFCYSV